MISTQPQTQPQKPPQNQPTRRFILRAEQVRELVLLIIIIAVVVLFGSQLPNFFSANTFQRVSDSVIIIVVVAIGQTLVVLTRNIDLSVGSVVGLTAFVVGKQFAGNPDFGPVAAIGLSLGIGALAGAINGLIIAYGRVPAIVATLGTMALYRGVLFQYANNSNVSTSQLPQWITELPRQLLFTVGSVRITLLIALAVLIVVVFQLALIYLPAARRLYAVGSDPETAQTSGIPARRLIFMAHTVCGMLAGLGGFMYLAKIGTITSVAAQGMELDTVAAVVLGGVNIFGGSGRAIGTLLGAILVGTLEYGLIRLQISEFWKEAAQGAAILLAVATDTLLISRLRASLAKMQRRTSEVTVESTPAVKEAR